MKLKWGNTESRYFAKPVKTAEKANEWAWWGIFLAMIVMEVIVIGKIVGIF